MIKVIIVLCMFTAGPLILSNLMLGSKVIERSVFGIMFLLIPKKTDFGFFYDFFNRGGDRGIVIGFNDLLAWSVLLFMITSPRWKKIEWAPKSFPLLLIMFMYSASTIMWAPRKSYVIFTLFLFIRAYIFFIAVANYLQEMEDVEFFIRALVFSVSFQGFFSVYSRYFSGMHQLHGTFGHQNALAQYVNMVSPIFFSMMLYGKTKFNNLYLVGLGSAAVCIVGSLSRGGMAIMVLCLGGTLVMSSYDSFKLRKIRILMLALLGAALLLAKSFDTIYSRFTGAPESSADARDRFNNAALEMANDETFGVGLNNFYYSFTTKYIHVAGNNIDRCGPCHHVYFMWAAETGWIGMWFYVLILVRITLIPTILVLKRRQNAVSAAATGLMMGLVGVELTGLLEPSLRGFRILTHYASLAGLGIALDHIDKRNQEEEKRMKKLKKLQKKRARAAKMQAIAARQTD